MGFREIRREKKRSESEDLDGYVQNEEQNTETIWQRIKKAKDGAG